MTMGGAAQQVFDWQPVAVSAHSVGGNKAQCHGNHIKSTLKLIDLQKRWKLCWYLPLFCPRCMFLQSHVSLKGKKTIRWEFTRYGSFITKTSLSHLKQYILWVYVYDVVLVSMALSILYCTHMYEVLQHSQGFTLNWRVVLPVLALMLTVRLHDSGPSCSV